MSWSEVFPILTDEMVDAFVAGVSKKDQRELDGWFAVKKVFNERPTAGHVVSTSLFWKNIRTDLPDIVIKSREQVLKPNKKGLLRFDPWTYYVEPVLKGAFWLGKHRPEAVFRVYLAADLEFLVPDLVDAGCEVHLMKSNSLAHNPGAMWRFLAFDGEAGQHGLVTVVDADRAAKPGPEMDQTVEMARLGLGWWRVPVWGELNEIGNACYRPIVGCHFGTNERLPARLMMQALVWTTRRARIETSAKLPGCKPARVHGSVWPDYGFDEWFLQTSVYPRAAFDGLLSFVPSEAKSRLLPLDIEYAQWANARSEMIYFGRAGGGCCGTPEVKTKEDERNKPVEKPVPASEQLPPGSSNIFLAYAKQISGQTAGVLAEIHPPTTLVVARYQEDLSWLLKTPRDIQIVVYNKGPHIVDKRLQKRIHEIIPLKNTGREADTYLNHLLRRDGSDDSDGWTVFCQGEPFTHSPDFLKLLQPQAGVQWKDVQCLTWGYNHKMDVPHRIVMETQKSGLLFSCPAEIDRRMGTEERMGLK